MNPEGDWAATEGRIMISGEFLLGSIGFTGWQKVVHLRQRCWWWKIEDLSTLDDGHDQHAFHFLVRIDGELIASARLCIHQRLAETAEWHLFPVSEIAQHGG